MFFRTSFHSRCLNILQCLCSVLHPSIRSLAQGRELLMRGIDQVYCIHSPAHGELTVYDTLTSFALYNLAFNFSTVELMTASHESSLLKSLEIDNRNLFKEKDLR